MNETAIRVFDLGKEYRIGGRREPYKTFRNAMMDAAAAPVRGLRALASRNGKHGESENSFWALKDVNFEIERGQVVGVIGRNGAGKSTLLKILSRITEPTEGGVDIYGRVGSLLEVGTGFHPELTGRENIYLNGAIIGMRRGEIEKKFDEIVAFAEVEKFIDTAVKHYSSGMYLRLAFAVAAHLEPEVLLLDEVLSVGDAAFQKKCLGKMGDIARQGRTIVFVSHDLGSIGRLCERTFWLDAGKVQWSGKSEAVIAKYLTSGSATNGSHIWEDGISDVGAEVRVKEISIQEADGTITALIDVRKPFYVQIRFFITKPIPLCYIGFQLKTLQGVMVFESYDIDNEQSVRPRVPGEYSIRCEIPGYLLNTQTYTLSVYAGVPNVKHLVWLDSVLTFEVEDTGSIGSAAQIKHLGTVSPLLKWQSEQLA